MCMEYANGYGVDFTVSSMDLSSNSFIANQKKKQVSWQKIVQNMQFVILSAGSDRGGGRSICIIDFTKSVGKRGSKASPTGT